MLALAVMLTPVPVQVLLPRSAHVAVLWQQCPRHGQALDCQREACQQAGLHWPQPEQSRAEQELQSMLGEPSSLILLLCLSPL